MSEIGTIGLDIGKDVFQVHGVNQLGARVLERKLRRHEVAVFFETLQPCVIGMEATSSAHYWARLFVKMGHTVRLMPAAYVKAYVKTNKNDARDAEAICEAVQRPTMRYVSIKSAQQQAVLTLHRSRDLLVRQRVMLVNGLRSHLAEFGFVTRAGRGGATQVLQFVNEATSAQLPLDVRFVSRVFVRQIRTLTKQIETLERRILRCHRHDSSSVRLSTIPGVGPLTATVLVATIGDGRQFRTARHFAAWLGLVPRQFSSGGKQMFGHISKRGERNLRRLLFLCASRALRQREKAKSRAVEWAKSLRSRKPYRVAVVALANKLARIAWALLAHGGVFNAQPPERAELQAG
jgi:transposase